MARNAPPSASSHRLPPDTRLGVVVSTFHSDLTHAMVASARATLEAAGLAKDGLHVVEVPGAFEIPIVARSLAMRGDLAAVLCFGVVIKGETTHDYHIASAVSHALQRVSLDTDRPMLMGVLTCNTLEQAQARALPGGTHDKGAEVAQAAVAVLAALKNTHELGGSHRKAGFGGRAEARP